MKYIFLICFSLVCGTSFAQNAETRTQEQDLMRWVFSQCASKDTIKLERYRFRKGQLLDLRKEFPENEYAFLVGQLKNAPATWQPAFSEKAIITEVKPCNKYYCYSTPLLTSDGQYAVIVKEYRCGNICGEGNIMVLRKTKDGWEMDDKKLKSRYSWAF